MEAFEKVISPAGKKGIKRAVYVFFSVMILLTFFSSTLNNIGLVRVITSDVDTGSLSYTIEKQAIAVPCDMQELYMGHALRVNSINLKKGDAVSSGQILAEFDVSGLEDELKAKAFELEQMKLEKKLTALKYDFDIEGAEQKVEDARNGLDISMKLYDAGVEAASDTEKKKILLQTAEKELKKLKQEQSGVLAGMDIKLEKLGQSIASVKAEIEKSRVLRSPTDGFVWETNLQTGCVADTSKPIIKIAGKSGEYYVDFTVTEKEGKYLRVGDSIQITVPSLENKRIDSAINSINPSKTDASMEIGASFNDAGLKGGEMVEISIKKESGFFGLIIPNVAVHKDTSGRYYAYVVKERKGALGKESFLQKAYIYVKESDEVNTAVDSGLSPFETVVVESDRPVMAGDRVKIQRERQ